MNHWITGAIITAAAGAGIAYVNYLLSRYMLKKKPDLLTALPVMRQCFNIAYLAAVYFLAPYTPWDRIPLLVAAVIGITIPMFFFTYLLVKQSDRQKNDASDQ